MATHKIHACCWLLLVTNLLMAQTPVVKPDVLINKPALTNLNAPDLNRGLAKYDPSAPVKYIFYDNVRFTELSNESLPATGDFLSLFTVVNGKTYTLVPAGGLDLTNSRTTAQGLKIVEVNTSSAAPQPRAPAVFKVSKISGGYILNYAGIPLYNADMTDGGWLGLSSGQPTVGGSVDQTTMTWQLQAGTDGGNKTITLTNTAANAALGITYSSGRVAGTTVSSSPAPLAIPSSGCPIAGSTCQTKWNCKILRAERTAEASRAFQPAVPAGQYFINSSYDTKSLIAFGSEAVFGETNTSLAESQWRIEPTSRGTYFIFNVRNNNMLGMVNNRLGFSPFNENNFYYSNNFQWVITGPLGGLYSLRPFDGNLNSTPNNCLSFEPRKAIYFDPNVGGSYFQQFILAPADGKLWGFIDMHTHLMSHIGFGSEFFYGGVDGDPAVALGDCSCMHDDNLLGCSNLIRGKLVKALDDHQTGSGYPNFDRWPKQSTQTHQQMWYEWVDRARKSGLRMIIALAQSSHLLADGMETKGPYDDERNMIAEIDSLISFVKRHPRIMDTVTTPQRMRTVVQSGKLAVVIGIEMDNIGDFYRPNEPRTGEVYHPNPTNEEIKAEIDMLYNKGVRYVFPVHIINNAFGGAAVYGSGMEKLLFNISNFYATGKTFQVEAVSKQTTGIGFRLPAKFSAYPKAAADFVRSLPGMPVKPEVLNFEQYFYTPPMGDSGVRNVDGLSQKGIMMVSYLMSKGIMIDIDHMSEKSVLGTTELAQRWDYPINSGHNGPRAGNEADEKTRSDAHYSIIKTLGGMVGVGTGDAEASNFVRTFRTVYGKMDGKNIAIGTDVGVGAKLPAAPSAAAALTSDIPGLPPSKTGNKTWDFQTYNKEGVDHYGMLPEFIHSLDRAGFSREEKNEFYNTAEYFAQMWEKCMRSKSNVRL
jgi:microsomal dipeptidase-like Zn-dependent dipeptidase